MTDTVVAGTIGAVAAIAGGVSVEEFCPGGTRIDAINETDLD